jgi:N-acetylmuramoyl-L-alanine amidase
MRKLITVTLLTFLFLTACSGKEPASETEQSSEETVRVVNLNLGNDNKEESLTGGPVSEERAVSEESVLNEDDLNEDDLEDGSSKDGSSEDGNLEEISSEDKAAKESVSEAAVSENGSPETDEADDTYETNETVSPAPETKAAHSGLVVCIDPGHQGKGNSAKEPVGPGSNQMKAKVSSGTEGRFSGVTEHALNLQIGLALRDELERRGYTVIMTRTTEDVDLSNSERAMIANNNNADAFIRIHANGSDNASVSGAEGICQTKNNPWNADEYAASRKLCDALVNNYSAATGIKNKGVIEEDNMSGINWSQVPVCIFEMGYMTNKSDDLFMNDSSGQKKMVEGLANGVDEYFGR